VWCRVLEEAVFLKICAKTWPLAAGVSGTEAWAALLAIRSRGPRWVAAGWTSVGPAGEPQGAREEPGQGGPQGGPHNRRLGFSVVAGLPGVCGL